MRKNVCHLNVCENSRVSYHTCVFFQTLTWHPWRSALLGIGAVSPSLQPQIAFWDAASAKMRETSLGRSHYSLDCMLFSHRTGEMVLSLWNAGEIIAKTYLRV